MASEGSSKCGLCGRGEEAEAVCEKLWSIHNKRTNCVAHWNCMRYSSSLTQYSDYAHKHFGGFLIDDVEKEIRASKKRKCAACSQPGASAGCPLSACPKIFHFYCAEVSQSVVTKKLTRRIVNNGAGHEVILYRVFCSPDHQQRYEREGIEEDLKRIEKSGIQANKGPPCDDMTDRNSAIVTSKHASVNTINGPLHTTPEAPSIKPVLRSANVANNIDSMFASDDERSDASDSLLSPVVESGSATQLAPLRGVAATGSQSFITLDEFAADVDDDVVQSTLVAVDDMSDSLEPLPITFNISTPVRQPAARHLQSVAGKCLTTPTSAITKPQLASGLVTRSTAQARRGRRRRLSTLAQRRCDRNTSESIDTSDEDYIVDRRRAAGKKMKLAVNHTTTTTTKPASPGLFELDSNNSGLDVDVAKPVSNVGGRDHVLSSNTAVEKSAAVCTELMTTDGIGLPGQGDGPAQLKRKVVTKSRKRWLSKQQPSCNISATNVDHSTPKRACCLCVPITGEEVSQPSVRDVLLQFAVDSLNVQYYDVYIWHYVGRRLSVREILELLVKSTDRMSRGKGNDWTRLLFETSDDNFCANNVSENSGHRSDDDDDDDDESKVTRITDNLLAVAGRHDNHMFGHVEWLNSLRMHAVFFMFDDVTDPNFTARRRLPNGYLIHRCPLGIRFTDTVAGSNKTVMRQTASERQHEFHNLHQWLMQTVRYSEVHVFPNEHLLCVDDDGASSVAEKIRRCMPLQSRYPGRSRLVFIRPTVTSVVSRSGLIRRVVGHVIDELLTACHSVYIVTDVDSSVVLEQDDFMPVDGVKASLYSGLKHLYAPISAVVIHLTLLQ